MKIHLATDHAGYEMKEFLKDELAGRGYNIVDHGAHEYQKKDDYPDYIKLAAKEVSLDPEKNKAIIFGGSGQGEAISANRFSGVRATTYYSYNLDIIRLSREHNNANILSLGARFLTNKEALESVLLWLDVDFTHEDRHLRRIGKIEVENSLAENK